MHRSLVSDGARYFYFCPGNEASTSTQHLILFEICLLVMFLFEAKIPQLSRR